ncbi:shikimate dehydrogenase family protein [Hydrogenophaga sp. BPS33]|uniref:shikimate dehydrogenase family protein n=1 Tax=Hydrogenophaga sp. BPS33 TaxID=2651974 RepID=UPI00131F83B7|nr:shikimate dehydrogenase [Hydrogenophaga sp. BPS33]QHE86744.1 shikimate dehydrogenase [Hydrogenophaga sp. BPS33]
MINGKTLLLPLLGYPTDNFKSPLIYNPWFAHKGIDAVLIPMGVSVEDYPATLRQIFTLTNLRGALVTMPHKVATVALVDELTPTAHIAGACNAVRRLPDGHLLGDQFDGAGFVRGLQRKGVRVQGARALVVGNGGVGCAIAASLAQAGAAELGLYDAREASSLALGARLHQHYPQLIIGTGANDPKGYDIVVNATPMGVHADDPFPFDVERLTPGSFVGEAVMKPQLTALLTAAQAHGCGVQVGSDMLYEQIPAYLEFFELGSATPQELRAIAAQAGVQV